MDVTRPHNTLELREQLTQCCESLPYQIGTWLNYCTFQKSLLTEVSGYIW